LRLDVAWALSRGLIIGTNQDRLVVPSSTLVDERLSAHSGRSVVEPPRCWQIAAVGSSDTKNINSKLAWLQEYFEKNLRLDGASHGAKRELTNTLSWSDFEQTRDLKRTR